jgi:hypothetical protein
VKLGALNRAIDDAAEVFGGTRWGPIAFKKGSLKAALRAVFKRNEETGWRLDANGILRPEPEE